MTVAAHIYRVVGDVTGDPQVSERMSQFYKTGAISVIFRDANGDVVQPTAGTIRFDGSETSEQWGLIGEIDATEAGPDSTYVRLNFGGFVDFVRVTPTGITGAETFDVKIQRFET